MIDLRFGDALELMKQILDKSIDCVVIGQRFSTRLDNRFFVEVKE